MTFKVKLYLVICFLNINKVKAAVCSFVDNAVQLLCSLHEYCAVPFRFISGVRASSRRTGEIPPVRRLFQVESGS